MTLIQRDYQGERDWPAIAALVHADHHFYHPVDFPWRLCSTSLEDQRNARVWENEHGQMQAFAALQFPWLTLDYAIRPEVRSWDFEQQIIAWAEARLGDIARETGKHFPFNVSAFAAEEERIHQLEALGYQRWEHSVIVLQRLMTNLPAPQLPDGFIICLLDGERDVEAYVALQRAAFDSNTMTVDWRRRTLRAPFYNPRLDLVAVAPDGRLAGFCIWWYAPYSGTAQIEPLGVHPDFQRLGLSQALMAEGLRLVANLGARVALVETYSFSEAALKSYQAVGFQPVLEELKFYKDY